MNTNKLLSTLALLLMNVLCYSQLVNNVAELNNAINDASPGATIILANGIWNNVFIDIDKNGTFSQPITITAQNPGSVLMTGNSRVYMEGEYLTVSGLVFQDASDLVVNGNFIEPVFELDRCDHCKVINNKIDSYNGTEAQKTLKFKWILADESQHIEIAYNSFIGKYGIGSIINDNRQQGNPDYLKIHHNYFADRTPINGINDDNDQDAIRIGTSSTSLSDSFSEVYENYFYNFFGELEVISNKSGRNKYYNNTFRDYGGCLTLRHGDNCEVYGNYFFAEHNYFTGGVRVIGEGHKVYNNYIEATNFRKPSGASSSLTGGINVMNGLVNTPLSGYYQVKNAQIINNTFVDCDYALRIGTTKSGNNTLEPVNLVVANNVMYNSSIDSYQIATEPSGSPISEGNITNLPASAMSDDGNLHRLASESTAVDAGIGNYTFLTQDVLGGERDTNFDAGAEEFGANGTNLPFTQEDVGLSVGFGTSVTYIATSSPVVKFGVCGSTLTFELNANVDWTITNDIPWLSLDVSAGSGSGTIIATAAENTTGAQRTATISFNENAGENDASTTLSIVQLNASVPFETPTISTTSVGTQDIPTVSEENAYNDDNTNFWTGNPDTDPEVSITFDLGEVYFLTEIGINFWKADERTTTFSIAIADDDSGPFTTILDNEVSSDVGVTVNTEQLFSLGGTTGRYVKFIGIGNSSSTNWTSIANVNIYGDVNCENAIVSNVFNYQPIDESISIFPVPATNGTLNILSTSKALGLIEIYNVAGQLVLTTNGNDGYSKQIDVTNLDAGMYFMKLEEIGVAKIILK